jgi:hypothetical protein
MKVSNAQWRHQKKEYDDSKCHLLIDTDTSLGFSICSTIESITNLVELSSVAIVILVDL